MRTRRPTLCNLPNRDIRYVLTSSVRRKLKKPIGALLLPSQLRSRTHLSQMRGALLIITVGDRVTETLHKLGRTPELQVIDGRERRVPRDLPAVPYRRLIRTNNPAGTITAEAIEGITSGIKDPRKPVRVFVDGEEDLLAIPAVMEAPEGSLLYYGQPKRGVVLVRVDERAKESARKTLSKMRKER